MTTQELNDEIDHRKAVAIAKEYAMSMFETEGVSGTPTLEEIWFDEYKDEWNVTVGLVLPQVIGDRVFRNPIGSRTYKVVRVSARDGRPLSIRFRDNAA